MRCVTEERNPSNPLKLKPKSLQVSSFFLLLIFDCVDETKIQGFTRLIYDTN
jgi:hypothetical protein